MIANQSKRYLFLVLLLSFLLIPPCKAQVNTASVLGRISDSSGAVVPGARVTVRNLDTNLERSTEADAEGSYSLSSLPLGRYSVTVTFSGFKTEMREGIVLAAGDRVRLDFALSPGNINETVTVTGEAPLINSISPERGVLIDSVKVQELPLNGRNFTQLVELQSGVQSFSINGRSLYSFNGSTSFGMNITLDGTDASFVESPSFGDPSNRSLLNTVGVDSVQEFRVQTGTFSAETGRASSGGVNVISKSGTNNIHGSIFEYFRNDVLDARTFFAAKKDPRRQNQFGATLGGPIIKDKIFFYGSYEGARLRNYQLLTGTVPTADFRAKSPAVFQSYFTDLPLPTDPILVNGVPDANAGLVRRSDQFIDSENLYNIRGDYNTGRAQTFARYSHNRSENSIPFMKPTHRQTFTITNRLLTLSNTYLITNKMVNEFRFGYNSWDVPRASSTWENGNGTGQISITGILAAGNIQSFLHFQTSSYTFADNLAYRAGRHSLKMGFEIRRLLSERQQRQNPNYSYTSAANFLANRVSSVLILFGNPGSGLRHTQTGFFLQDDFQLTPRLMLNLGLRYEYYSVIEGVDGKLYNIVDNPFGAFRPKGTPPYNKDPNNFNPRFGLAYDVTGNQKTVFRGGFGVYTSPLPLLFIWDMPTIDPRQPLTFSATPTDIPNLKYPIPDSIKAVMQNPETAAASGLLPAVISRRIVPPKTRDTYSLMWNASVQQRLFGNWALEVGYVANHNLKTINSRSTNLIDPITKKRTDPSIGEILIIENSGKRKYQALQLTLRGRNSHGLSTDINYTWGHGIVYGGDDCCANANARVQDNDNIAASTGDADVDVRHMLTFNFSYELLRRDFSNAFFRHALKGWTIQGISRLRTGLPVNIVSGRDQRGNGLTGSQRVNYVGGSMYAANKTIDGWFNPAAFALPATGQFGNLGYNALRGPASVSMDISLLKNFVVWREHRMQFRAEFFNFPNHPNFDRPVGTFTSSAFGKIQTSGLGRIIQFSLRYQF